MKLYEIAESYKNLVRVLEDNSDNEELKEIVKKSLSEIEGDLVTKCDNIVKIIKNMEADINAYKEEEKRLNALRKIEERKVESLKKYLHETVAGIDTKKVKTSICNLSIRKTPPKVIITDEEKLGDYKVVRFDIDKIALKEALKNGEVEGAYLESGTTLSIR